MRTREGLQFEKAFSEVSNLLLGHLRAKPECRDLVTELLNANAPNGASSSIEAGERLATDKRT